MVVRETADDPYSTCVQECSGGCDANCVRHCTTRCCDDYQCDYSETEEFCCQSYETCCDGRCPSVEDDSANCGGCGIACQPHETCCSGRCVDLRSDGENCGRCGQGCGPGRCDSGTCDCANHLRCGDTCVAIDDLNCGSCGTACRPGLRCRTDRGVVDPVTGRPRAYCGCPEPSFVDCSRGVGLPDCRDVTGEQNCGGCGNRCTGGKSCSRGLGTDTWGCWCPVGRSDCGGTCVDLLTDSQHCGTGPCGVACTGGMTCQNGVCLCPPGLVDCSGTCVNLAADVANCGACGHACTGGKTCQNGVCLCPPGLVDCSGTCVNLAGDVANCGSCGRACSGGRICQNGTCVCPSGHVDCAGTCRNVREDPANCGSCGTVCAPDRVCFNGSCQCRSPAIDCQGTCRDRLNDPANCGSCGNVCPPGTACCNGACRDITGDPKNCGACNRTCPPDCTGAQRCAGGVCVEPRLFEVFIGTPQGCALRSVFYSAFDEAAATTCAAKDFPGMRIRIDPPQQWPVCARCPQPPPLGDYVLTGYFPAWSAAEAATCWSIQHQGCSPATPGWNC